MRKIVIFSIFLAFVLVLPVSAALLEVQEEYILPRDQTITDNLYVGSGNMLISGTVIDDFVAAGGNVLINGSVLKDIAVAGGSINILGEVGGDARALGGQVIINQRVGGDVLVAGGSVSILSDATVGGDVIVAGGQVVIDGLVNGDVKVAGGKININGTIVGNVQAGVLKKLTVGSNAVINGDVSYNSPLAAEIADGATISGKVVFNQTQKTRFGFGDARATAFAFIGIATLLKFLAVLGAGIITVLVFKNKSFLLVESSLSHFWWEALRALIVLIVAPVLILLLFLSVIGSFFSILGILTVVGFLVIAKIFAGIIFGAWLYKIFSKTKKIKVGWDSTLIGIAALQLIGFIPIVGWIINWLFLLSGFGTISHLSYQNFWAKR